jgi:small-conductance mechanosensitive channel
MFELLDAPLISNAKITITAGDVVIFFLVFIGAWLLRLLVKFIVSVQTKRKVLRKEQGQTLLHLSGYLIYTAAFFIGLDKAGIPLSYFFVGSAALLVGVGFSLQQLFQDVISGVILLLDRNINIGDVITTPEHKGKIESIGIRTTQMVTIDNEFIVVPNSKLLALGLHNLAHNRGLVRFRIQVGVAYGTDMARARQILIESALADEHVDQKRIPTVTLNDFGNNSLILELRYWSKELFFAENVKSDIRFTIEQRFREAGITIPFPQLTVHLPEKLTE